VIFLALSTDAAALRGGFGEERYEKEEMQRKVRELFNQLRLDRRDAEDWRVVDASGDIEEVSDRIWGVAEPVIESVTNQEIRSIL
jgi:dTMP kinase